MLVAGLAAGAYFVFFAEEDPQEEVPTLLPRPSSVFPGELPATVGDFRLIIERLDKVDAEPNFTGRLGALYKNDEDQQLFHSVVRYKTVEEADSERETELNRLLRRGFSVEEEIPTKQALGGEVGTMTYLRHSKDGREFEAVVWSNEKLAVLVQGPQGAVVGFFNELTY